MKLIHGIYAASAISIFGLAVIPLANSAPVPEVIQKSFKIYPDKMSPDVAAKSGAGCNGTVSVDQYAGQVRYRIYKNSGPEHEAIHDSFIVDQKTGQFMCNERQTGSNDDQTLNGTLKLIKKDKSTSLYSFKCGNWANRTSMNGYFAFDNQSGAIVAYGSHYLTALHVNMSIPTGTSTAYPMLTFNPIKQEDRNQAIVCDGRVKISTLLGVSPQVIRNSSPFDKLTSSIADGKDKGRSITVSGSSASRSHKNSSAQ